MTLVQVAFVLIFASEQLCTAEYVVYGRKMTLDDNLSLNLIRYPHPDLWENFIKYIQLHVYNG